MILFGPIGMCRSCCRWFRVDPLTYAAAAADSFTESHWQYAAAVADGFMWAHWHVLWVMPTVDCLICHGFLN